MHQDPASTTGFLLLAPRRSVLVVEDDEDLRETLVDALGSWGFDVRGAPSAEEALVLLRAGGIHVLVTDLGLPGADGISLMTAARSLDPDLDVILMTGEGGAEQAVSAIRDGASDWVTKPCTPAHVRRVVESVLYKRKAILEERGFQARLQQVVQERTQELRARKEEVERLYQRLADLYEGTLLALLTALDLRDNETQGHSLRVVEYAVLLATEMGVREPDLGWIRLGSIFHDIGKIGVPDTILKKPGGLDPAEWAQMRLHPDLGCRLLQAIPQLEPVLGIVRCHEERWDGSGYPQGLQGEEIPLGARIFAVVDAFDAMTSDRPYRPSMRIEEARKEIRRHAGTQFDPDVAEAFLRVDPESWRAIRIRVHRRSSAMEELLKQALR